MGTNGLPTFIEAGAPHEAHLAAYKLGASSVFLSDGRALLCYPSDRETVVVIRQRHLGSPALQAVSVEQINPATPIAKTRHASF